jgi:hypothetical protein
MDHHICQIWRFETANLVVTVDAYEEDSPDFSFDTTGEIRRKVAEGDMTCFRTEVCVSDHDGNELATVHLGDSIYEDPKDFRDHIGLKIKSREDGRDYGSYFSQMVREACQEAREKLLELSAIRVRRPDGEEPSSAFRR